MKSRLIPMLAAALIASAGLAATATAEARGACRDAIHELCGEPGTPGFRDCVREKKDELPEECREKLARKRAHWKKKAAACREDVEKLCGDVEPGEGRVRTCIREHRDELSEGCRQALERGKRKKRGPEAGAAENG